MMNTPSTFGTLVSRKNATLRRAIRSVLMPLRWSAHAPSARPPAPPVGRTAFAPSSERPICALIRQLIRLQNTLRNTAT